jgi:hypothetical protein
LHAVWENPEARFSGEDFAAKLQQDAMIGWHSVA